MSNQNIRVLIVDDHAIVRAGFKQLLGAANDINVIAEACSGEEAIKLSLQEEPDVVVMDINMPGIGGIEAISRITARLPEAGIIALTVYETEPFPTRVMEAGAKAYLTKRCAPEELVQAVRETYAGGSYISQSVRKEMAKAKLDQCNPLAKLSSREFQVFDFMARGQSVLEVSDSMHLSHKTIYTHKANIQKKLNLETHLELIQFARQHNVIDD